MGTLNLPTAGAVYLDTNPIIYSVEKHPIYGPLLISLWQAAATNAIEIVSSELVLLETLVGPLKSGNSELARAYEELFQQPRTRLLPISLTVLKAAASLRATVGLKTPDAIHLATAADYGCALFVTNDVGFHRVTSLPVIILSDFVNP